MNEGVREEVEEEYSSKMFLSCRNCMLSSQIHCGQTER